MNKILENYFSFKSEKYFSNPLLRIENKWKIYEILKSLIPKDLMSKIFKVCINLNKITKILSLFEEFDDL